MRTRSQLLLSGVSAVAVLAALGVADPALATTAVTGPGVAAAVTNSGTDTDIAVSAGAVVQVNGSGNSITNTGTLTGAAESISIDASTILGNILNSGTLNATGANDGIDISNGSVVLGGISNTALIQGAEDGIEINDATLIGGITNSGASSRILGATNAIVFTGNSVVLGGVTNAGTIAGSDNGIYFGDANVDFIGDVTNSVTGIISGAGAGNAAINMTLLNTFVGDIVNAGQISATGASAMGVSLESGAFTGDITNTGTVSTTGASAVTISLAGGTLTGDISNSGLFLASGATGTALLVDGALFDGTIVNAAAGVISASGAAGRAIDINTGTVTGGIANAGSILATGANGVAVRIAGGAFSGGVSNAATGLVSADDTAVLISIATFTGNVSNSGSILSDSNAGIVISGTVFNGSITNASGALIDAATNGISWTGATITGDVTNAGDIIAGSTGIALNGTLIGGGVTNSGDITADVGIALGATGTITDDLTNDGTIVAATTGILVQGLVSGDLVNTGVIDPAVGIQITGTVTGTLDNAGTVIGTTTGIAVDGVVAGGITNSGTITGGTTAIDVSGADAATDITLTDGLIQGGNGGTVVNTAVNMNNAFADTFTAEAGQIFGSIVGAGGDDVVMGGGGTLAWLRGTGTGLDQFDAVGGTVILGAGTIGQTDGAGVTVGAASMAITSSHVYLDDDTAITLTGALDASGGEGVIEWFLTTDNTTFGQITAATGDLGADTEAAVFIDPETFAAEQMAAGSAGTIVYQDVIDTGGLSGAFSNANTITTSSLFFEGTAIEDAANNIDIVISRNSFATVLSDSGAAETANQGAVGGALEAIYLNGTLSTDFEHLFEHLFEEGLTTEEIQHAYDELAGAEHADIQEIGMRATHAFVDTIGERLDDMKSAAAHTKSSELGLRRYAEAPSETATDASPDVPAPEMRGSLGLSVWGRAYDAWTDADGDAEAAGYDQDTKGGVVGIDYAIDHHWAVGMAAGWSTTDVDFATAGDGADIDSLQFAAFGAYESGRFYADALFALGFHDVSSVREVELGFDTFTATAGYDADTWALHGEAGAVFEAGRYMIQPFVALGYLSSSTDGFTESGADGFDLVVDGTDADSLASTLGVRFSGTWKVGGVKLIPDAEIAWRHEYLDERQSFDAALAEYANANLHVVSSALARDAAVVNAGVAAQVGKRLVLFLDYNGVIADSADTHAASAGVRATW